MKIKTFNFAQNLFLILKPQQTCIYTENFEKEQCHFKIIRKRHKNRSSFVLV